MEKQIIEVEVDETLLKDESIQDTFNEDTELFDTDVIIELPKEEVVEDGN